MSIRITKYIFQKLFLAQKKRFQLKICVQKNFGSRKNLCQKITVKKGGQKNLTQREFCPKQ